MDFRKLRYFVRVAEEGSFAAASARLHVTQPALSRHVKELETELGVTLLIRQPRGVRPTDIGRKFLKEAKVALAALERAMDVVRSPASVRSIHLMAPPRAIITVALIDALRTAEAGFQINVLEGTDEDAREALRTNRIQAALCHDLEPDGDIKVYPLCTEDLYLVGPQESSAPTIAFRDLAHIPLVLDGRPTWLRKHLSGVCDALDVSLDVRQEIGPLHLLAPTMLKRRFFTLVTWSVFQAEIEGGVFSARRVVDPGLPVPLKLAVSCRLPEPWSERLLGACHAVLA